jgi:hypothetical protein
MIPPWDVSITQRNYFALVVFLQLIIVVGSGAAMAQNFNMQNLQTQLNQGPSPQIPPPNFNVGRSSQPSTARTQHKAHTHKKQQSPAGQ